MRLFAKKSDHPLADIKSAQMLLDGIPKNDALKAVQELSELIEIVNEPSNDFRLDHQWALLRMFDQAAQVHLRSLRAEFFSVVPLSEFQSNRIWTLLDSYYTQSEACHYQVLARYRSGDKGATLVKPDLAVLCTRGIASITEKLKLGNSRFSLVDPSLWKHLSSYYGYAELQGCQVDPVAMYAGINTTVAQKFAVLLAWYASTTSTVNAVQSHIAETIYTYLSVAFKITSSYSAYGLYVFDVAQPTPPMRVTFNATIHPSLRFIEAEGIRLLIENLVKTLDKGILPDGLTFFGAKYEVSTVGEMAQKMLRSMAMPPAKRRHQRRLMGVCLNVANGLLKMMEQSEDGLSFVANPCEVWNVEDVSATGMKSVVTASKADGIKIGTLVGVRANSVSHWAAGVVRRLSRDAANNLHVGIEMLSPRFEGVVLKDKARSGAAASMWGLYLNRTQDMHNEAWLLTRAETFSAGRSLVMTLNEKDYLLLPIALCERGDDYDLARYRLMQQDSGYDE